MNTKFEELYYIVPILCRYRKGREVETERREDQEKRGVQ